MKKIYNKIPLASVLFTLGGFNKIRVVDYTDRSYRQGGDSAKRVVFEGLCKDAYRKLGYIHERAELLGMDLIGDTIQFEICTSYEIY